VGRPYAANSRSRLAVVWYDDAQMSSDTPDPSDPGHNSDRADEQRALAEERSDVAEEQRDVAEGQRSLAEMQREVAEEQRDKAEDSQLADESLRRVAEKKRKAEEQLRRNAEHVRQAAEEIRKLGASPLRAPEHSLAADAIQVAITDQKWASDDLGGTAEQAQGPSSTGDGGDIDEG
jgi:hypothetical protein